MRGSGDKEGKGEEKERGTEEASAEVATLPDLVNRAAHTVVYFICLRLYSGCYCSEPLGHSQKHEVHRQAWALGYGATDGGHTLSLRPLSHHMGLLFLHLPTTHSQEKTLKQDADLKPALRPGISETVATS